MMALRARVARRLRFAADRIDPAGAPRAMSVRFTFEERTGIVFRDDGRRCRLWRYGDADYERAHDEAGPAASGSTEVWLPQRVPAGTVLTWEDRMASRAAERRKAALNPGWPDIPAVLAGELPPGMPDTARYWCTSCGLPDALAPYGFEAGMSCPRCGSPWRWHGRLADRDGTATGPPDDGTCPACYDWRRYPDPQEHFGWAWHRTCAHGCACAHHADEVWLA